MTKVTAHFDLARSVTDADASAISDAHSVYGIARVWLAPSLDKITVDFDASRLTKKDAEAALIGVGIPLRLDN